MTEQEATKIVNSLKIGEEKVLADGTWICCESYTSWGYSMQPAGDSEGVGYISKGRLIAYLTSNLK